MRTFKPEDILKNKKIENNKIEDKKFNDIELDNNTKRKAVLYGLSILSVVVLLLNFISVSKAKQPAPKAQINVDKVIQRVYGVAVNVDGQDLIYLKDNADANKVLEKLKTANLPADEKLKMLQTYFKQDVTLKATWVEKSALTDVDTAVNTLLFGNVNVQKYTVKEGDNLWLLARKNDMRVKDILAANPGLDEEKLSIGQEIFFKRPQPKITVVAVLKGQRKKTIPYDTKVVKDSKMSRGKEKVVTEGKNGTRIFTYEVTTVNGIVTDKKILADNIAEKPVTKVIASGLARRTTLIASRSGDGGGSGNMLWPTSSRRISSPFGYRGGEFHTGLDIDGSTGDPVVAADSGKVIMTGRDGGYGKTVVIDHGNGIMTRYAHLSSYSVSEGENIGRGEYIGAVGSTGRSTGSHLHFEVLSNGSARNPKKYID